jgi:hypothetical protein
MKVDKAQLHPKKRNNHPILHDASSYGDSNADTKDIFGTEIVKGTNPQLQMYNQQDATSDSV